LISLPLVPSREGREDLRCSRQGRERFFAWRLSMTNIIEVIPGYDPESIVRSFFYVKKSQAFT